MRLERSEVAHKAYAHVYLSPHLDDVVLSCGGTIALQRGNGEDVLVVSAFSGGAEGTVTKHDPTLAPFLGMQQRREEDARAMARLQVDHLWLGYHEAIQRDARYRSFIGLISHVLDRDTPLQEALWSDLLCICRLQRDAALYFPLGVGNHVDHHILFELGARMGDQHAMQGRVRYYEDAPYAFIPGLLRLRLRAIGATFLSNPPSRARQTRWVFGAIAETYQGVLELRIVRVNATPAQRALLFLYILYLTLIDVHLRARRRASAQKYCMQLQVIDITDHLHTKLDAAGEYRSQIAALFGGGEVFRQQMERYSASVIGVGGRAVECYWRAVGRAM